MIAGDRAPSAATAAARGALPWQRLLPPTLLLLLTLLCWPFWLDFEQARRGLLLLLVGGALLAVPALPRLPTQLGRAVALLGGWFAASALLNASGLNWWEAAYRLAHLTALAQLLRLGRLATAAAWQRPAVLLLLLTAAFGLLQRLGCGELSGYGTIAEPVSVFGNANVAAEATVVLLAAAVARALDRPRFAAIAIAVGGAYLAVNGTRAALLLSLPAVLLWLGFAVPAAVRRKAGIVAALGAGLLAGLLIDRAGPAVVRPQPAPEQQPFVDQRQSASVQVRLLIAASCAEMAADAPCFGCGPGQFAIQYPRHRRAEEIELSSHGRQFATEVRTAHDDWLEILVEGGVPALLLLLAVVVLLLRSNWHERARLLPLVALLVPMVARAPLGNAPAVAVALLLAAPASGAARGRAGVWADRALGLSLLALGLPLLLGNARFAGYQAARAAAQSTAPGTTAIAALGGAAAIAPFEPRYWHLLAQERLTAARDRKDLEPALAAAEAAIALRPYEPSYQLLAAELLLKLGRLDAAKEALKAAAAVDAGDPQLLLQLAGVYFTAGDADAVVAVLCTDPHPRLRRELAKKFDDFAQLSRGTGDEAGERRFFAEACFVRALDALGAGDRRAQIVAEERVAIARGAFRNARLDVSDPRLPVLTALLALEAGDAARADAEAMAAVAAGPLQPWQRSILQPHIQRLRPLSGWTAYLEQ